MRKNSDQPYPPWAWPHLLGLDAPIVAIAWQRLVSQQLNPIPIRYTFALGLTVWTIYLADRFLDTTRPASPDEPLRHHFARSARPLLLVLILANLAALPFFGPLPLTAALPVITALLIYFLLVHAFRLRWPKELAVAVVFALGVAVPFHPFPFLPVFAFLCFWNCTAIEYWESGLLQLHPVSAWLARQLMPSALMAVAVTIIAAQFFNPTIQYTLSITFSLCAALAFFSRNLSPLLLRVAADLILLTPLLAL